jgi:hypothetical protein
MFVGTAPDEGVRGYVIRAIKNAAWVGRVGYFLSSSIIAIGWG